MSLESPKADESGSFTRNDEFSFLTRNLTGATQTDCVWEGNDVI